MKKILIIFQFLMVGLSSLTPQTRVYVDLQNNSLISIKGTSNLLSFKLSQSGESLSRKDFIILATQNQNKIYLSNNVHSISVKSFTSNNKMALRDFLKLVKSDIYPSFQIQLNYIETTPNADKKENLKGNVSVNITITGVTKPYIIPVSSEINDDTYKIIGKKKLNIRDFGLTPPVEMMGLIKVNEWIEIDFNIICKISTTKPLQKNETANSTKS